jgi:hypothetical protein
VGDTITRAETVLFLGESHTLSFSERVISRPGLPPLVTQPIFIPNAVSLATITNQQGVLYAGVRNALKATRLLVDDPGGAEDDVGIFMSANAMWRRVAARRFTAPPLVVVCMGSYDIFRAINEFPSDDFDVPDMPYVHPLSERLEFRHLADHLGVHETTTWFVSRVKPLQAALVTLREYGFARLAFLAIPPPTLDAEVVARAVSLLAGSGTPGKLRPAFRYKAALYYNALAAQICAAEGVDFLDSWPMLTEDGLVRDGALVDGVHLSDAMVDAILLELVVPAAARAFDECVVAPT